MPASCNSSELSSHQVAIRSHPGIQKMPASGIPSKLSAHQMPPAGAIAHSRPHLCPRASSHSFSSLVSPLRPFGSGLLGRCDPRAFIHFYVVTDAGPASHRVRLWQGGPASTYCRFRLLVLPLTGTCFHKVRLLALPEVRKGPWLLRRPRGDGNGGRFVRSPCLLRGAVCACCTPYTRCFPFMGPCTAMVHRAPGHNRWGVVETSLPVKTQGRTLDCPVRLISVHNVSLQSGF